MKGDIIHFMEILALRATVGLHFVSRTVQHCRITRALELEYVSVTVCLRAVNLCILY